MSIIYGNTKNDYQWYIEWSEGSVNISNNTSVVTAKLVLKKVGKNTTTYNNIGTDVSITIDGSTKTGNVTFDMRSSAVGTTKVLLTHSKTITHNSDGKKSISLSAKHVTYVYAGTQTVSGTATLQTIPRASSFSMPSGTMYMGSAYNIGITPHSSSFTHTVYVALNNESWSKVTSGLKGSANSTFNYNYTIPSSWISKVTSSETAKFWVKVDTYNGSTLLGSSQKTYTITVPTWAVPTIHSLSVSEANSSITGGKYISGKSKFYLYATASGNSGSTISSYQFKIANNSVYSGVYNDFTSGTISESGSVKVEVIVKDSRGRSSSKSITVQVYAYSIPNITKFISYRSTSSGVSSETDRYARIDTSVSISNLEGTNSMTVYVEYRVQYSNTWTTVSLGSYTTNMSKSNYIINVGTVSTYNVRIKVVDKYSTVYSNTINISPTFVTIDFRADGKGVCFGSTSDKEGIEIYGQKLWIEDLDASKNCYFNGDLFSRRYTQLEGTLFMNSITSVDRSSEGESKLYFLNCSRNNWKVQLYGGSSTSDAVFGLWDNTNNRAVWKYNEDGRFHVYRDLYLRGNRVSIQTSTSGVWNEALYLNSSNNLYVGASSAPTVYGDTLVRGKSVRLYAHNGGVYLGSSGSTAVTSDRTQKRDINVLTDKYKNFFENLTPVSYKYNEGHRDHVGFIAQDVEDSLLKSGLTTEEFGGLVIEKDVTIDYEGDNIEKPAVYYDKLYSLRYEEFIALNTLMIQDSRKAIKNIIKILDNVVKDNIELNKKIELLESR